MGVSTQPRTPPVEGAPTDGRLAAEVKSIMGVSTQPRTPPVEGAPTDGRLAAEVKSIMGVSTQPRTPPVEGAPTDGRLAAEVKSIMGVSTQPRTPPVEGAPTDGRLAAEVKSIMGVSTQPRTPPVKGAPTDGRLAAEAKALLARRERTTACQRHEAIVAQHQRRAGRIAYHYLCDPSDVDKAVQDAFLKTFLHLPSFRDDLLCELWLTKIVVNGCLDRLQARKRRLHWIMPGSDDDQRALAGHPTGAPSPEATLLAGERDTRLHAAVDQLPRRQPAVVVLSQLHGLSTRDVSHGLGLREATVRVHLFRAIRALRKQLSRQAWRLLGERARPSDMALWARLRLPQRLATHLSNRELLDALAPASSAVSESGERTLDPRVRSHLLQCAACRSSSESLSAFLRELTTAIDATFAKAFPPERLATQRQRILRRLTRTIEPAARARVLRFPTAARPPLTRMGRWVAVAAAAGLVAGFSLGQLAHVRPESFFAGAGRTDTRLSPQVTLEKATPSDGQPAQAHAREWFTDPDAAFQDELELVLSAPQVPQLTSLDELTPRIRDVAVNVW